MKSNKKILTVRETAKVFGFPEFAVRTLIKKQAFPVVRVGNRCYIVREIFEEYLHRGGELFDPKKA